MGALLKGVGSLFPPNTIANKLATGNKISAKDVKNAISDVSGSLQGTRGILGGNTPAINVVSLLPAGGVASNVLKGLSSVDKANKTIGGIATLTPSATASASAQASQISVGNSLYAGATGQIPNSPPVYASNVEGIKGANLDANGNPKKPINPIFILGGIAVAYFLFLKK